MQDAKSRQKFAICAPSHNFVGLTLTIGKKVVKQQYLFHMAARYGELRSTNGWDLWRVWGTPAWQRYCTVSSLI